MAAAAATTANRKHRRAQDQQGQNDRRLAALPGNHECHTDQSKAGERLGDVDVGSGGGVCGRDSRDGLYSAHVVERDDEAGSFARLDDSVAIARILAGDDDPQGRSHAPQVGATCPRR